MINEIIFDCETKKLFNEISTTDPADLGVSIVSVYVRTVDDYQREISGKMYSFWEQEFPAMWAHFATAQRIVGFNSIKFDIPALIRVAPDDFGKLPHFDIMTHVYKTLGHMLSLDTLATQTLGQQKTDVGTNAVLYWKSKNPVLLERLKAYCEADVLLTRDLYDFGVREKYLKYKDKWNTIKTFPVDFSYPKNVIEASRQIGLF
jgi:DEAD/DEAH box helicase domain-containing protein